MNNSALHIQRLTTPLAWIGVGLSTAVGIMTIRTHPSMALLATATGAAWLALAWFVSRDDHDVQEGPDAV